MGKLRHHLGKMRPIWAICMKSGQKCSRIKKKNSFIFVVWKMESLTIYYYMPVVPVLIEDNMPLLSIEF